MNSLLWQEWGFVNIVRSALLNHHSLGARYLIGLTTKHNSLLLNLRCFLSSTTMCIAELSRYAKCLWGVIKLKSSRWVTTAAEEKSRTVDQGGFKRLHSQVLPATWVWNLSKWVNPHNLQRKVFLIPPKGFQEFVFHPST